MACYTSVWNIRNWRSGWNRIRRQNAYVISNQQEDFINLRDGGLYIHGDEEHFYYIYYTNRIHFSFEDGVATLEEPVHAYYMKKNENHEIGRASCRERV